MTSQDTPADLALREVESTALDRVEATLAANDLPVEDVRSAPATFYVATVDDEFVGIGGVEVHGRDGLLRSVVVTEPNRGRGFGTALCDALEERAREAGVRTLYLLTTTAAAFFHRCGYRALDREDAPPCIRKTAEFSSLCPTSATCMQKPL